MRELLSAVRQDSAYKQLDNALKEGMGTAAVFGLPESHRPVVSAALAEGRTVLLVASTPVEAVRLHGLILPYLPDAQLYLPRDLPLVHLQAVSADRRSQRLSVLSRLILSIPGLIVSCSEALMERLAPPEVFLSQLETVSVGEEHDPRELLAALIAAGYERCDQIEGPGQCSLRGDLLDVYPPQASYPYRIEFFGDEIDQIRTFDSLSQRSLMQQKNAVLPPAYETPQTQEAMQRALRLLRKSSGFESQQDAWEQGHPCDGADMLVPLLYAEPSTLFDYFPKDVVFLLNEPQRILDEAKASELVFNETLAATLERGEGHRLQQNLLISSDRLGSLLNTPRSAAFFALFRTCPSLTYRSRVSFTAETATQYLSDFSQLSEDLRMMRKKKQAVLIYAGEGQERVKEQFISSGISAAYADSLVRPPVRGEILVLSQSLPQGFVFPVLNLVILTGFELFGKRPSAIARKKKGVLRDSDLTPGDYVVHEVHGIGRFLGVEQLTVQKSTRDYLLFAYRGEDRLYIPTDQLDRIQKYIGTDEDHPPQLSKLGSSEWQNRVSRARESAKKLAVDLARLYAERSQNRGFAFSRDNAWQKRMEDAFPYEETPDQAAAISDVKRDMESPRPMDRLLCGDVGYGKTEVAMRAAFKAVQDSKQVAFLVPTTILAQQHYATLSARFAEFPVRVACLSRFQSPKEAAEIKKKLSLGEIDIVVGTHALLSKSVAFKDLGLLIIDEEHRFGVNHKEQIKALKGDVDVLTLTATPIPRTLNLSMTGIRDISNMETPPENRFPVQTFVLEYNDALISGVLSRELARGGQCFIVSNRVASMSSTAQHFRDLLPSARIEYAHGQMSETELENTMLRFLNHESDILICSTIIESGMDIPNANTMVILEADRLGLAQLYQLRGRVGRSSRMAYAYLTVPASSSVSELAQKRLLAIREFTQFGAGFRLAMRDLELRGAGSLLGAEQHGHISDVGYEYYCKLMRQAVAEVKGEAPEIIRETTVDVPVDAYIPKSFLPSELHRLAMYKRIAQISDRDSFSDLLDEFNDRYGDLPEPVMNLMQISLIRAYAGAAGFTDVSVRDGLVRLKYDSSARPDGMRLLAVLSEEGNARLLAGDPVTIEWMDKSSNVAAFLKNLPQFLYRLKHCILPEKEL